MMLSGLLGGDDAPLPSVRELWRRLGLLRWLLLLLLLLIILPRFLRFYTDVLWFDSLGQAAVFWTNWKLRCGLFTNFFALTFGICHFVLLRMERAFERFPLGGKVPRFDGSTLHLAPEVFMRPLRRGVSIVWSFLIAATMSARWDLWALFFANVFTSKSQSSSEFDPVFSRPLEWYFFIWPLQQMLVSWLTGIAILVFIFAAIWAFLGYISRLGRNSQEQVRGISFTYAGSALAGVLVCFAWQAWLSRYALLWHGDDAFTGLGYVGMHIVLPSQLLLAGVLLLAAIAALINAWRLRRPRWFIIVVAAPLAVFVLSGLVASGVANYTVKPNQQTLELPFIKRNIEATRRAYRLDNIQTQEFSALPDVAAFGSTSDPAVRSTLDNVRLWDWRALEATLAQTQTLGPYYHFPDVDVDRYVVNGRLRQVMIAARELDTERLPTTSRNWVNERLIYTHGYGAVMNTASDFTPEGRPRYLLSEMPVRSSASEIKITRPEIYFGQSTSEHVYVKTRQKEFNFPSGESQAAYSNYEGNGGIRLGGFFRRLAVAWALGDISKIPFSDAITRDTRVLLHREIRERVTRLAPFLILDHDPYLVVGKSGKLFWMMDAYTSSLYHPYSAHVPIANQWTNYLRNSVKIVIDAYEGTTAFYVFDDNDPIINTWRSVYPTLFKDAAQMPADLQAHVRYPELFFRIQSQVLELYHSTDPAAFFQRNNLWSVAQLGESATETEYSSIPGMADGGSARIPGAIPGLNPAMQMAVQNSQMQTIEPYFLLTRLPGQQSGSALDKSTLSTTDAEFILSVPFTLPPSQAANRATMNLSGWLAARCDAPKYGELVLYPIPRSRNVDAPQQIRSRIKTNTSLSERLSLWNASRGGSRILWGNLLVIPVGRGVLYVQPLFLQTENSQIPELATVVLATQDRLVYASTYAQALTKLLGTNTATSIPDTSTPLQSPPSKSPVTASQKTLIDRAARELADYQRLTAAGRYGEAGQRLESLRKTLEQLRRNQ